MKLNHLTTNKLFAVNANLLKAIIFCFVSLFIVLPCMAESAVHLQSVNVKLALKNTLLSNVIEELHKQTGYEFSYDTEILDTEIPAVSVNVSNETIENILKLIFDETDIHFKVVNNRVFLRSDNVTIRENGKQGAALHQQQGKKISGKVTYNNGTPVISATIVIQGDTTNGTVTDIDGNYTLVNVPENATLMISYVGMKPQSVPLNGRTVINVTLYEDTGLLEEIVVVGFGTQKKVNLTGSVAMIDGEEFTKRPVVNVTQSLQGVIPGLTASIPNAGGTPGKSFSLQIRGQGNLSGSDAPYILVDGVEMNLADVNPNDIASISVLKDAAAAAIYGARAAYGVILVTTKKGEEDKMRVSYQGSASWSSALNLPKMVNGYEFAKFFNDGNRNAGVTPQYSEKQLEVLKLYAENPTNINSWPGVTSNNSMSTIFENNSRGVGSTDWFKFHYKNYAFKQNHNISFTGGNKIAKYYISGGYYDEEGLLRYADINYRQYNFNSSLTSQLTEWLKLKLNTKYSNGKQNSPFGTGAINESMFYHGLARFRATVSPYDLNGNFSELSQVPYLQSGTYTETMNTNSIITGGLELEPIKRWKVFFEYTYKKGTTDYEALATPATFIGIDGTSYKQNTRSELGIPDASSFLRSMAASEYQSINLYSNYNFTLAKNHNFILMGGYQEENNQFQMLQARVVGLINTTNPGINLATGDKTPSESRNGWATRGFFGRINYDYDGKYLLELNGRYDGSSRFLTANRWGWFPSISIGWNMAHEKFMQPIQHVLSSLKLRASYGELGNQSGARLYTFSKTMNTSAQGNWYFTDGRNMIIWGPETSDPNVTWEKVKSKNGGVDFGIFNNRLTGSFDLFERITRDMLGPSEDVADMFGASVPNTNNAVMRSRGWEFTVNYRGKIGSDIDYSVGAMVSDAQSTVLEYRNPTFTNPAENWYKGRKVGEIWGYRASGIIQTQAEADTYNDLLNTSYLTGRNFEPGDLKFIDLNDDNAINRGTNTLNDMGDMTIIGNSTPRYQFSLNGFIRYKNISLSALFQGVGKRDYNPAGSNYFSGAGPFAQVTVFKEHLDYWREDNPNAYFTKPYISGAGNNGTFNAKTINTPTDYYLQNASYIRLKNLTINYELPQSWLQKVYMDKVSLFLTGENLFTITDIIGFFDPELVFVSGAGGKNYPLNRIYSMGLILNF
ncbi:MAG: TonB-dependent receptor [Paludibacter sp.]|nr:TonB-dependent receptor [Paludibacter sp.]MDD4198410.1 TonB-dependent receptor [Paludibacter sp.]MDD4427088.1 TonB-dependent receptor [Paludibacter sp.]